MKQSLISRTNYILTIIFISLLSGSYTREPDAVFVDFSNPMVVERPGNGSQKHPYFEVAVGSIISARETVVHYHELLEYIAARLGREIKIVQRKTYGEINQLISAGQIDLAFICSGPYASGREKFGFEALAVPRVRGSHLYQSYLIVARDSATQTLMDLRGKVFAFTDPESNTGKIVPIYWLGLAGNKPEKFFGKTIYTYSHDNSIMAVARSLVDGAAVNGQVWEYYHQRDPVFTAKTRIIRKSELFGNPPVVASPRLPSEMKERMRDLLFNMNQDPVGSRILKKLMIDRFIPPIEESYDPILAMKKDVAAEAEMR